MTSTSTQLCVSIQVIGKNQNTQTVIPECRDLQHHFAKLETKGIKNARDCVVTKLRHGAQPMEF